MEGSKHCLNYQYTCTAIRVLISTWPRLFQAWLALTIIKYHSFDTSKPTVSTNQALSNQPQDATETSIRAFGMLFQYNNLLKGLIFKKNNNKNQILFVTPKLQQLSAISIVTFFISM